MWSSLNLAYFDLRDVEMETIWNRQPGSFYDRTEGALRTVSGVAEGTIYRDDGWHFLQLGRFVERVQSVSALIDAHIALFPTAAPDSDADWLSLLWICEAHFAYRRLYSQGLRPTSMVDFLVADPSLSHSIRHALGRIVEALDAVAAGPPLRTEAERRAGRMAASIDHDWPDRDAGDDDATRAALQAHRRLMPPSARRHRGRLLQLRDRGRAVSGDTPRRFLVEHLSDFRYQEPAQGSLMVLRLQPREDGGQRVASFALEIDPAAFPVAFRDAFGNACHLFNVHRAHEHTAVRSQADVETAPAPDLPDRMEKDAWDALAEIAAPLDHFEFLSPSRFARPSPALAAFTEANGLRRGDDPLSSLLELSHRLHTAFSYEPGSTAVDSPIEHILETGSGVCQDYTHVMIAIARGWGVPSRYVSGYIHREGAPGEQTPEGASHAWAEFLLPGLGWLGIDPTNDTLADHRHVRVAVGRDYADAAPTRGAVFGGGESRLDVRVTVSEGGEPEPSHRVPARAPVHERRHAHPCGPASRRRPVAAFGGCPACVPPRLAQIAVEHVAGRAPRRGSRLRRRPRCR